MNVSARPDGNSCSRCGTCCRKGGPALHHQDRLLVENGSLRLDQLYTIRKGEMVNDNVRGGIGPVSSEIIKIKSKARRQSCLFYDQAVSLCRVYSHRPLECRLLKCWDTRAIREIYDRDRLTREDLLKDRHACWDLVAAHQQQCDYERIAELVRRDDRRQLAYLIRYDAHIRQVVLEKTALAAGLLDFLFGLPLSLTIARYRLSAAEILRKNFDKNA